MAYILFVGFALSVSSTHTLGRAEAVVVLLRASCCTSMYVYIYIWYIIPEVCAIDIPGKN